MIRTMVLAVSCLVWAPAALAQALPDPRQSVLQILCFSEGGETKATGFVWPEPGYMVTALHAVAGCENGTVVSEHAERETTIDRIVAVDREPDLALVRLSEDMGVPALALAEDVPDADLPHFVWGYPMAAAKMTRDEVRFAIGLSGILTTLGGAYSHADLQQLYSSQDYPTRETQIFRVASLLQHGQSGAPILDAEGRLVAIADGGLLGGWRGMNWSIPAHVYLPGLPDSRDEIPREASRQTLLMNSYAVREERVVQMGDPAAGIGDAKLAEVAEPAPDVSAGVFQPGGLIPLGEVRQNLGGAPTDLDWILEDLEGFVAEADWTDIAYEVMIDTAAERWIVAPARTDTRIDPVTGALEAVSADGAAVYAQVYFEAESFETARRDGILRLTAYLARLSGADDLPELLPPASVDAALEYANHDLFYETADGRSEFDIVIQINGPIFSGRIVHRSEFEDDMSDAGWTDYRMMQLAAYALNDLEAYYDPYRSIDWPVERDAETAREASALTLVRRVPLADVAAYFVEDQDFNWKRDLAYLRSVLPDPSDFDDLRFDVYEDRATGATVAVPEGMELAWNADLGAVEGVTGQGRVHLAVAIHRGATFEEITAGNVLQFIEALSGLADWDGETPADCEPEFSVTEQRADCWGYFVGTDRQSGVVADLYLGLTALQTVFLGTSVYIIGAEEDLDETEIVAYLMARIGAEYLSDFAVR